jgi:hypothetical protein
VDPCPTPNSNAAGVADTLSAVRAAGKPIMLVAQAFGGGEGWKRAPSAREERLMSYLGLRLLYDCVAIQHFIRSAPISFPCAASAWSEIRTAATEVFAIQSALVGGVRIRNVTTSHKRITAGAWVDRGGSIVVVVANTGCGGAAADSSASFNLTVPGYDGSMKKAVSVFEQDSAIPFQQASCTLSDQLRGMGTRVYRISNASEKAAAALPDVDRLAVMPAKLAVLPANLAVCLPANLAVIPANLVYNPLRIKYTLTRRFLQQEHTQQDAIGGQGGHSAKRPDWACKPNHFLGQSQSEGLHFPVSVAKREFCHFCSGIFQSRSAIMATRCRRSRQAAPRGQPRCSLSA